MQSGQVLVSSPFFLSNNPGPRLTRNSCLVLTVMFSGSQKSELRTHKMAGQQQDCIDESTWFYMKPLYITRAQFIQNIMTSQYYNTHLMAKYIS